MLEWFMFHFTKNNKPSLHISKIIIMMWTLRILNPTLFNICRNKMCTSRLVEIWTTSWFDKIHLLVVSATLTPTRISNSACSNTTHGSAKGSDGGVLVFRVVWIVYKKCMWPKRAVMSDLPSLLHTSKPPFDHHSSNAQTSSFQRSYAMFSLPNTHLTEPYWFLSNLYPLQSVHKLIDFVVFMWEKLFGLLVFMCWDVFLIQTLECIFLKKYNNWKTYFLVQFVG
jgi:hypothetical protein